MTKHPRNNPDPVEVPHPEPDQAAVYLDYGPVLPAKYNQDIIVTMVRDPECIFTYWELSGQLVPEIFRLRDLKTVSTKWLLRTRNLTLKSFSDIELAKPEDITNVQGNYYLTVAPDMDYQTELGLVSGQNFIPLVKSNMVRTPRKGRSSETTTSSM